MVFGYLTWRSFVVVFFFFFSIGCRWTRSTRCPPSTTRDSSSGKGRFFFLYFYFFLFFFGLKILVRVSFVLPPLFVCLGFFSFFFGSLPPPPPAISAITQTKITIIITKTAALCNVRSEEGTLLKKYKKKNSVKKLGKRRRNPIKWPLTIMSRSAYNHGRSESTIHLPFNKKKNKKSIKIKIKKTSQASSSRNDDPRTGAKMGRKI